MSEDNYGLRKVQGQMGPYGHWFMAVMIVTILMLIRCIGERPPAP